MHIYTSLYILYIKKLLGRECDEKALEDDTLKKWWLQSWVEWWVIY